MLISSKQKNRWNRFLRERKYRISVFGLTPHFDWKIILFTSVVILVFITIFSFNIHLNITNISETDITTESIGEEYVNSDEINAFLSEFQEKEMRFNDLMNTSTVAE
jgi:hypothetical protein